MIHTPPSLYRVVARQIRGRLFIAETAKRKGVQALRFLGECGPVRMSSTDALLPRTNTRER